MNFSDIAIKRPVFTTMVTLFLMIMGAVSLGRLGVDLFPDINFPIVSITTVYPGAGPEEVERLVTRPLEDGVASINGLDRVKSFSREGVSVVVVQFKLETDIKLAAVDVREKVAKIRSQLPKDIQEPVISRVDPGATPVVFYTVSGKRPPQEIRQYTEDLIKKRLESIEGVAAVNVQGGLEREIQVNLSGPKLQALNLSPMAVAQVLQSENIDVPAGRFTQQGQEVIIRAQGQFRSVDEIGEIILPVANGAPVKLREVATIVDGSKESRLRTRVNGISAVTFEVVKASGTNTLAIVDNVEKQVVKFKEVLPSGLELTKIYDSRAYIEENTHELQIAILFGGAMAILIIFLFMLDWRSTLISALALPTSVITTFWVMYLLGFTLNMMSLLALSLAIGLLIDDAVVVRENIFRHMELGEDPMTAASKGTREIALAVTATTLTIVAVFVPVAFTSGMIGQFFRQFGLTITAAVLVSLFIAFTLDPMLSARLVKSIDHNQREKDMAHPIKGPILRFYEGMDSTYRETLAWALRHRVSVMILATIMFFGSLTLVRFMGTEFFPKPDRGQFMTYLDMPAGTSIDSMDAVTARAEAAIHENPYIVTMYTTVGVNSDPTRASIRVIANDKNDRPMTLVQIMEDLRGKLQKIPDLKVTMTDVGFIEGAVETPIQLNIRGSDYTTLLALAEKVKAIAKATPGATDISSSYVPGKPEYQIRIDRAKAADLGINMAQFGLGLRASIEGDTSSKLRLGEKEYDIRVRLRPEDRDNRDLLDTYSFPSRTGRMVQLREFAEIVPASGPSVIERENRQRQITITGNVINRSLGEVVADITAEMNKLEKPEGYTMVFTGEAERMADSARSMGIALMLGIIFIYLVLASQFESFIHPFTIMFSLPLAVVGALLGLFLTGHPLGMSTFIGIILLMGLVTKNAILLVDYTNQLREEKGLNIIDALMEAGPTRLRPILMTSMAMVLGMLPTAISTGSGSEFRAPMAIAVIGGVITSTILTLVVVPVVYTWMDRLTLRGMRERRNARKGGGDSGNVRPLKAAALGVGLLLMGSTASAEETSPAQPSGAEAEVASTRPAAWGKETSISLEDAYKRALEHNPDLAIARSRLDQTRLIMNRAYAVIQPFINVSGNYTYNNTESTLNFGPLITSYTDYQLMANGLTVAPLPDQLSFLNEEIVIQPHNSYSFTAAANWGLFNARTLPQLGMARATVQAVEQSTEQVQREILYGVAQAYYGLYGLQKVVDVSARQLESKKRHLELTQARLAAGQVAQSDVLRAEVEVVSARRQLRETLQAVHNMSAEFATVLGLEGVELRVTPPTSLPAPTSDPTQAINEVLDRRPDVRAVRAQLKAAELAVLDSKLDFLPTVSLTGLYRYSNAAGFSGSNDTWSVGATANLPVWDGGLKIQNAREARMKLFQAQEMQRKLELQIRKDLQVAYSNVEQSRLNLEAAEQEARLAKSTYEQMEALFQAGRTTALELRDVEILVASAEIGKVRAELSRDLAILALNKALGNYDPS